MICVIYDKLYIKYQGCGSDGSGRIRYVFLGSGSGIIIPDPDPTNIKTNF